MNNHKGRNDNMDNDVYHKIITFARNMKPNGPFSNIYYTRKYDINGNLIGEYYGMNHFTNYGMNKYCTGTTAFPTNLYIGFGNNQPFNRNTPEIVSRIMDEPLKIEDATIDYGYPVYYYQGETPATSYITCMCKFLSVSLDYNKPEREVRIAEYGLGESQVALWTHSKIYNKAGEQTYITKRLGEKIEVDVFLCMSYSQKMIDDAWDDGVFTVITQMNRFLDSRYRMYPEKTYSYRRNNILVERPNTTSTSYDNDCVRIVTLNDIDLYNQPGNEQNCICGFMEKTPGWCVLEDIELPFTESIDVQLKPEVLLNVDETSLSNLFGVALTAPFTTLHVDHVYLCNVIPNANNEYGYTNEIQFENSDIHNYCETPMQQNCAVSVYHKQNDQNVQMYLHMNPHNTDPIISFSNPSIGTLYATDNYWDTWTLISDPLHVPAEHQCDRFWITRTNDISLEPVRASKCFALKPANGPLENVGYNNIPQSPALTFDGYDLFDDNDKNYRYCVRSNVVYYPETKTYYTLSYCIDNVYHRHIGFGKWLLTFTNNNNRGNGSYLLTDIINQQTKLVESTFRNLSGEIRDISYITSSDTGIICIQTYNSDASKRECIAIDLRSIPSIIDDMSAYEKYIESADNSWTGVWCSCSIWGTSKIAYIPNGVREVHIYDFDTDTEDVYSLPSNFNGYTFMYGHSSYVWITSGNSKTYMLNIDNTPTFDESQRWTDCGNENISLFTNDIATWWWKIQFTCVDKVFMAWNTTTPSEWVRSIWYINIDDPTSVSNNLSSLNMDTPSSFGNVKSCKLRYVETAYDNQTGEMIKGTLTLIVTGGTRVEIIDFGDFMYNEIITNYTVSTADNVWSYIPYGEYVIDKSRKVPIIYGLRVRIVGTTKSVTAVNHIKHITGQSWETYFTNSMPELFDGIAPGYHE